MKRIVRMIGSRGVYVLEDGSEVPIVKYTLDAATEKKMPPNAPAAVRK